MQKTTEETLFTLAIVSHQSPKGMLQKSDLLLLSD